MPQDPDIRLTARLPSDPKFLPFVRAVAGEAAACAAFGEEDRDRVELAVVEGFTNVVRHAYGGRTDRPVELRVEARPGLFRLEMDDEGVWADPAGFVSRPLDQVRPGGLGVHLMRSTMDVVEYRRNARGGTTLVLEKRRPAAKGDAR
jgi:anti-sigma regulatory factor (Ser/Thr protein kinase)